MAILKTKLKAATLIEAIVSMVIVTIETIAFGIGMMIYLNILRTTDYQRKLEARLLLNEIAIQTRKDKSFIDEVIENPKMRIRKSIIPYKNSENLGLLYLVAFDKQDKQLAERKELIFIEH